MSLRNSVVNMVQDTLCRGKEFKLQDSDSLLENGVVDSLGILELVKVLESRFHVSVEEDELSPENLDSIESLTAYLRRKGVEE
jgi:acyl carrier protein